MKTTFEVRKMRIYAKISHENLHNSKKGSNFAVANY